MIQALVMSALLGFWEQPCLNKNMRSEEFSEDRLVYTESYFQDLTCKNSLVQFRMTGDYVIDGLNMDFVFTGVFVTVNSLELIQKYNQEQNCGISSWSPGAELNISGLWCDFFGYGQSFRSPAVQDKKYGIWKIENDILFLGQLTPVLDGSSQHKRPQVYNPRGFIKYSPLMNDKKSAQE